MTQGAIGTITGTTLAESGLLEDRAQEFIKEFPDSLGLGEVECLERELKLKNHQRLDLLLQDSSDHKKNYIVEVQRGKLNFDHVGRAIEYWAEMKSKDKKINYYIVVVAEEIPDRIIDFADNVKEVIPFIAINMTLHNVKVKNQSDNTPTRYFTFEIVAGGKLVNPEDNSNLQKKYKQNWQEKKTGHKLMKNMLKIAKEGIVAKEGAVASESVSNINPNYTKHYVGVRLGKKLSAFISFAPRNKNLIFEVKIPLSKKKSLEIKNNGLHARYKGKPFNKYIINIPDAETIKEKKDYLLKLIQEAYDKRFG